MAFCRHRLEAASYYIFSFRCWYRIAIIWSAGPYYSAARSVGILPTLRIYLDVMSAVFHADVASSHRDLVAWVLEDFHLRFPWWKS